MKNQLFEDLIESIKELPTEVLEEMRMNMNEEQMRKDFEGWFKERVSLLVKYGEGFAADQLRQREKEYYEVFKASRESLVVELPSEISKFNVDENGWANPEAKAYDDALADVKEALESQGIKWK